MDCYQSGEQTIFWNIPIFDKTNFLKIEIILKYPLTHNPTDTEEHGYWQYMYRRYKKIKWVFNLHDL